MLEEFQDQEFLGDVAREAAEPLLSRLTAAEKRLHAVLGPNWDLFLEYEEISLQILNETQALTVKRIAASGSFFCKAAA